MELQFTSRGFGYYQFRDGNDAYCSLQESSAVRDEGCIWLGMDKDRDGNIVHTVIDSVTGHKLGHCLNISSNTVYYRRINEVIGQ